MNDSVFISLIILVTMNSLFVGYFIGKSFCNNYQIDKNKSFFDKEKHQNKKNISIDDTKYVSEIRIDGLEKKYTSLGETKTSDENISGSINKLKNMKG